MNVRDHFKGIVAGLCLVLVLGVTATVSGPDAPPVTDSEEEADAELNIEALSAAPPVHRPVFKAPLLASQPAAGKGRLNLAVGGNRQWCTYRDDRVVQPPPTVGKPKPRSHNPIHTFGYQFTIAAVARARPVATILLYESPVIRTAVLRQAAKLGRGAKKPPAPTIVPLDGGKKRAGQVEESPTALVPLWQEQYACATLSEAFDFDLDPGAYDVYMAFDILGRSGNWAHRSIGFLTDIVVEEGRQTRVDGRVDLVGGTRRDVDILSSVLLPAAEAGAGAAP